MIRNIFDKQVSEEVIGRINKLTPSTIPQWGKMNVGQMLAHCNVTYRYTFEPEQFKRPSAIKKFLLRTFIKKIVTSEKPYPRNGRTAPEFIMTESKNVESERNMLIANIRKAQQLGEGYFEGKENFSFGKMTAKEWNTLFYKHLNHHLTQFAV